MFLGDFLTNLKFDWLNLGVAITALLILLPVMSYFYFTRQKVLRVRFSSLRNIKKTKTSLKVRLKNLPFLLRIAAISLFLIAFSHPFLEKEV